MEGAERLSIYSVNKHEGTEAEPDPIVKPAVVGGLFLIVTDLLVSDEAVKPRNRYLSLFPLLPGSE
jgi:hypothetical protein